MAKIADSIRNTIKEAEGDPYFKTKYFVVEDLNGKSVKIRVGNHSANIGNNTDCDRTISFVTEKNCIHTGLGHGNMTHSEYVLVDGDPVENWETLEQLLEYEDII